VQQAQCAGAVLMVRPAAFDYNPETAGSNSLQRKAESAEAAAPAACQLARDEFAHVVRSLRSEGVRVCVAEDTPEPPKPDAVFPNNWVSFHADGTVVLYPMQAENRRRERRREIIEQVVNELGFRVRRTLDLTHLEATGRFLEGTGSLVLDHVQRMAYACRSPRTHAEALDQWAKEMQYEPVLFSAEGRDGRPLYHTNVLMCLGARAAIVGTQAIVPRDRERVREHLEASGREIIEIDPVAVEAFAGNALELATWDEALGDCNVLVISTTARQALGTHAFARLAACTDTVLAVPVPTIERLGGGGIRCMLAEVFLPA
jgi:hypothetical protein